MAHSRQRQGRLLPRLVCVSLSRIGFLSPEWRRPGSFIRSGSGASGRFRECVFLNLRRVKMSRKSFYLGLFSMVAVFLATSPALAVALYSDVLNNYGSADKHSLAAYSAVYAGGTYAPVARLRGRHTTTPPVLGTMPIPRPPTGILQRGIASTVAATSPSILITGRPPVSPLAPPPAAAAPCRTTPTSTLRVPTLVTAAPLDPAPTRASLLARPGSPQEEPAPPTR